MSNAGVFLLLQQMHRLQQEQLNRSLRYRRPRFDDDDKDEEEDATAEDDLVAEGNILHILKVMGLVCAILGLATFCCTGFMYGSFKGIALTPLALILHSL